MAKKPRTTDLISAFTWAFNVIDNQDLPAAEQLTLLHILARANRAFWKPIALSASKLAAAMCKDKRSVTKSIMALESAGLIVKTEGGYILGIPDDELSPFIGAGASSANPSAGISPAGRVAENDAGKGSGNSAAEDRAEYSAGNGFKYFSDTIPPNR